MTMNSRDGFDALTSGDVDLVQAARLGWHSTWEVGVPLQRVPTLTIVRVLCDHDNLALGHLATCSPSWRGADLLFAHWADVNHARGLYRWLYAPVTAAVGEELRAGKLTLREALLAPERLLVVDQHKVTRTVLTAWEMAPTDVPQEVLPDAGETFGPDDLVTPPRPISCECASPGGLEPQIMQRRRACSDANKAKTPCRCACHAPGQLVYGRGGGLIQVPS